MEKNEIISQQKKWVGFIVIVISDRRAKLRVAKDEKWQLIFEGENVLHGKCEQQHSA